MVRLLFLTTFFGRYWLFICTALLFIGRSRHARIVLARRTMTSSLWLLIEVRRLVLLHAMLTLSRVFRSVVLVRRVHSATIAHKESPSGTCLVPLLLLLSKPNRCSGCLDIEDAWLLVATRHV